MSSFVLKIIAIISMFCDHIGGVLTNFSVLNYIGRIAFPIFAFQLTQGYIHTSNLKKYILRLVIFAFISQIPFWLFLKTFYNPSIYKLNIFFTLLLGLICIIVYEKIMNLNFSKHPHTNQELITEKQSLSFFNSYYLKKILAVLVCLSIAYIGDVINVDYGLWGVLIIFSFYLFRNDKLAMILSFITLTIIRYGIRIIQYSFHLEYVLFTIFTILSVVFISMYNGKKGKSLKYLFYIFYPLHLLIIYFIFR